MESERGHVSSVSSSQTAPSGDARLREAACSRQKATGRRMPSVPGPRTSLHLIRAHLTPGRGHPSMKQGWVATFGMLGQVSQVWQCPMFWA